MGALFTFAVVVQVLSAIVIIGLVLLQHGKGADMGAAFGSGASGSLFGASGSSNFLSKSTGVAAAVFFCATLALAFAGNKRASSNGGVMEGIPANPSTAVQDVSKPVVGAPASSVGGNESLAPKANQIPK